MSSHKWTGAPEQWTMSVPERSAAPRKLGSALLVGAALTSGAVLTSGTASASPDSATADHGMKTTQTLNNPKRATVKPNSTSRFSGTLKSGDRPLNGQEVELQWRKGNGKWHEGPSARTDEQGHTAVNSKIGSNSQWRLVYSGDAFHKAAHSPASTVSVEKPVNKRIVHSAAAQSGKPYRYGATGPKAFDCSGLTQFAHKAVGIKLPRSSQAQRDATSHVSRKHMKPGDLLFFGSKVYHVAVYAGHGKMWTAPDSGDVVKLQKIFSNNYTVGRAWS